MARYMVCQVPSKRFGRPWRVGEVLGVFLDLDSGTLSFSLSGEFLGGCFDSLPRGKDHTYFPAASYRCGARARARVYAGLCVAHAM
jgi:hypothetical protein